MCGRDFPSTTSSQRRRPARRGPSRSSTATCRRRSPGTSGSTGPLEPDDLASETFIGVFTGLAGFSGDEDEAAGLGLHDRPPPAGRRLAAPQPPSAGGRRPGRPHGTARRRRRGRRPRRRRDRDGPPPLRRAPRRPALGPPPADPRRPDGGTGRPGDGPVRGVGQGPPAPRAADPARPAGDRHGKSWCLPRTPTSRSGDDRAEMTTAADDTADEAAFEAFLAGRPVFGEAADLAAFAGAVRATATEPGRPNAALAELLSTGLLTDQSTPSTRTAPSAGSSPRRSRVRRRRRFAMFFPALLAKFLSAGAFAQAATGAGVVLVVATGAGATGVLGEDVQDTVAVRRRRPPTSRPTRSPPRTTTAVDDATTDPGAVETPAADDRGAGRAPSSTAEQWAGERPGRRPEVRRLGAPGAHRRQGRRPGRQPLGPPEARGHRRTSRAIEDVEGIEDVDDESAATPDGHPRGGDGARSDAGEQTRGNGRGNGNGGHGSGNGRGHN